MSALPPVSRGSLAARALLAVGLLVGFYAFALAMAAGLVYLPWAQFRYTDRVSLQLALFGVAGACTIVWAILPRRDRFEAPGPRLAPAEHPRLFAEILDVARQTGQAPPAEVYLVPDANAWVAERGGVMGLGSRRVMGLGLPLMQVLSVQQFRAVLAHEFGHYHGGDTALGPWIHRTRVAIARTLDGLDGHSVLISRPFEWYMKGFLRVTHALSRRQEFVADAVAARVAGAAALAGGLRVIHGTAGAFDGFWYGELEPALAGGFRLPIADGFARFLAAPEVAARVEEAVAHEMRSAVDPYDTHPPLRDRLIALGSPRTWTPATEPRATTLLADVDRAEAALLAALVQGRPGAPAAFAPLAPEGMLDAVWVPGWQRFVEPHRGALRGLAPAGVPALLARPGEPAVRLGMAAHAGAVMDEHRARARHALGAALALLLWEGGHLAPAELGRPITARVGGRELQPFDAMERASADPAAAEEWREFWEAAGLASRDLSAAGLPAAGAAAAQPA